MRRIFFIYFFLIFNIIISDIAIAVEKTPQSLFWVGNSFFYYNNSMHNYVIAFARADQNKEARGVSLTISGSGIDWHDVSAYLRPGLIGRYSFSGDNKLEFNKPGPQFDAVILMDCSQCPIHPQLGPIFHQYAKQHARTIRQAGAEPIFFMSWAYKDKPEMTDMLAAAYDKAGHDNKARVIPAGLAFANSIKARPDLELYQRDKRHPSIAGTYLAAATAYAVVYQTSPIGNRFIATLDDETAYFLQGIAWNTVQSRIKK